MILLPLLAIGVTLSGPNDFEGDIGEATGAGDIDSAPTLMTLVGHSGAEGVEVVVTISWSWFCNISGLVVLVNTTGSADVGGGCMSIAGGSSLAPADL